MNERYFVKNLLLWHRNNNNRELPWKGEKDPYKIWLSEIMLQQTRVEQAIAYYRTFIRVFPDICSLAEASETKVLKLWEGLGYYSRCRNMIATARYICQQLNGNFPADYKRIASLKGIGPYTAAAIASFAYKLPYAVVDGNVKRVLARFFKIEISMDSPEGKKHAQKLADRLLDKTEPDKYNQAIMDFGATVCKPVNPDCPSCPLNKYCLAYKAGIVNQLPVRSKKRAIKNRYFNFLILHYRDYYYVRRRNGKDIWRGLYEFPVLETDGRLLEKKELKKHNSLTAFFKEKIFSIEKISSIVQQQLTHQKIVAQFITIDCSKKLNIFLGAKPVRQNKMKQLPFPKIVSAYLGDENK